MWQRDTWSSCYSNVGFRAQQHSHRMQISMTGTCPQKWPVSLHVAMHIAWWWCASIRASISVIKMPCTYCDRVPHSTCGSQRTTWWAWFSLPHLHVPAIKVKFPGLCRKHLNPWKHLTGPHATFWWRLPWPVQHLPTSATPVRWPISCASLLTGAQVADLLWSLTCTYFHINILDFTSWIKSWNNSNNNALKEKTILFIALCTALPTRCNLDIF